MMARGGWGVELRLWGLPRLLFREYLGREADHSLPTSAEG
jgi:hypothetical protein